MDTEEIEAILRLTGDNQWVTQQNEDCGKGNRVLQVKWIMIEIRTATKEDAEQLLEIYDYYVSNTAISFENETPSLDEFTKRIEDTLKQYPYLVMEKDGKIAGYAYAGPFKNRAAYNWSCEISIYLDRRARKRGLGRILSEALEDELRKMGILNVYGCIAYPEKADEYLTTNSADYHEHIGFRTVGNFRQCAYKFGRWYNMIWMEKTIGEHIDQPDVVKKPQRVSKTEYLSL